MNLRKRVWERDNGICHICTKVIVDFRSMTLDHLIPRSKGGRAVFENLAAAHKQCNTRRGNKELMGHRPAGIHRDPMTVTILDRLEAIRDPWDEDFGLEDGKLVRMQKREEP